MLALGQENTEISVKIIFQLFLESNKLSISISIKVRWNVRLGKTRKGQLGRTDDCDLKRSHFQLINSDIAIDLIVYNINHVTPNPNYAKGYALLLCKNNVPRPISKDNHSFFCF